ncbi:type II toxin-antitoxin system VapC family toxin [Candidatus Daviesbacteria bacterium]|nr:type II toxin-antitoxin system VapC family toxin [Candidatus Daviesbacteria bacterium]
MAANTNTFVIDSSYLLAYLLPDENITEVQNFFDQYKYKKIRLVAPQILPFEIFNGLKSGILSKRVDKNLAQELGKTFLRLPIALLEIDVLEVFDSSIKEKLSFYDAAYVYLARKYNTQLLSLDQKLISKTA